MTKDEHATADHWGRGLSKPKPGEGAYSQDQKFKSGDDIGKDPDRAVDRSDSPKQKPYGSFHYAISTKDG
jgi:hypothetical protein